jgi:hypothetical protein
MRPAVSLPGAILVLLCLGLTLSVTPAGAQDRGPAEDQYSAPPGNVANPKDVLPDTAVNKKTIPNTGGPPYIALAAVTLLSVAVIAARGILRR